jgi:hypothetical protein
LHSAHPSRPGDFRPGCCPCRREHRAGHAAYGLDGKVSEAPKKGTKAGTESAKKSSEKLEEGSPYSTLIERGAKGAVRFNFIGNLPTAKDYHP